MNNLGDTIPVSITSKALTHNYTVEEKARREEALKNKDFYYDKGDKYIEKVTPDVDVAVVNLLKVIIKKRTSLLYSQNLVREFDGPSESISFLDKFYKDMNIDKFLYSVDIMAELTGTSLVHIAEDDSEYGIKLQLFDGSDISVLSNSEDPNIADAISLIRLYDQLDSRNGDMHIERILEQQIWTKSSVTIYKTGAANYNPKQHATESHTIGSLPFVPFKGEDVEGQYIGHSSATSWRKLNDTFNNLLTHLSFMIKMQSATPVVLEGFESGEGIMVHPGRAISIPMGASAEILDYKPKITDTLATVTYIEDMIYNTSSVPKVTVIGGSASSGRELMIQWFPLLQVFKDKAVRYQRYELQLANTILDMVELPRIDSMTVNYQEASVLPLSAEEDNLDRDINLNIKTSIDELMRRDPRLDENEAEAIILANREFNNNNSSVQEINDGRGKDI